MRKYIPVTLTFALAVVHWSAFQRQQAPAFAALPKCTPIGLVISQGDPNLPENTLICAGQTMPGDSGTVQILCFSPPVKIALLQGVTFKQSNCLDHSSAKNIELCPGDNRANCQGQNKGSGEDNSAPVVIKPYGKTLIENRPLLAWRSVPNATDYTVEVEGVGAKWQRTVQNPTLSYPTDVPPLTFGNAYRIYISANKNGSRLVSSSTTFNVLPESEVQSVQAIAQNALNLNSSPDEVTLQDLMALYLNKYHLLTPALTELEKRAQAGSKNPAIYYMLGQVYLEAGLPEQAKLNFQLSKKLAQIEGNWAELAKARKGLDLLANQSQLPTRINPLQK